jgi:hypothetical protein
LPATPLWKHSSSSLTAARKLGGQLWCRNGVQGSQRAASQVYLQGRQGGLHRLFQLATPRVFRDRARVHQAVGLDCG